MRKGLHRPHTLSSKRRHGPNVPQIDGAHEHASSTHLTVRIQTTHGDNGGMGLNRFQRTVHPIGRGKGEQIVRIDDEGEGAVVEQGEHKRHVSLFLHVGSHNERDGCALVLLQNG